MDFIEQTYTRLTAMKMVTLRQSMMILYRYLTLLIDRIRGGDLFLYFRYFMVAQVNNKQI